jgi:CRP/FNR family transcriptional regulator, anaerobic regulatory protein
MNLPDSFQTLFEPELLKELELHAQWMFAKAGDTIVEIGQTIRVIPILLSGTLKISRLNDDGNELLLYYINPGETCAMTFTCCMQQYPSEIKAVAEEDITFLDVPITVMDQWIVKYSTWKGYVMKTIRNRFNELLKSKATGSTLINLSHEQIARELASSREVISLLLKKLENDNRVLLYHHQVKLLSQL